MRTNIEWIYIDEEQKRLEKVYSGACVSSCLKCAKYDTCDRKIAKSIDRLNYNYKEEIEKNNYPLFKCPGFEIKDESYLYDSKVILDFNLFRKEYNIDYINHNNIEIKSGSIPVIEIINGDMEYMRKQHHIYFKNNNIVSDMPILGLMDLIKGIDNNDSSIIVLTNNIELYNRGLLPQHKMCYIPIMHKRKKYPFDKKYILDYIGIYFAK